MARKLRKGDTVQVITGDHRGETGTVLRVVTNRQAVVVEGVNMVYRHLRPSRRNPQGGRIQKEAPIHLSNVAYLDPKTGRGARVRFEVEQDKRGKVTAKQRVTVNGTKIGDVTRKERD